MIEKMKKATFLVFYKECNSFIEDLGELGLVHITKKPIKKESLESFYTNYKKLNDSKIYLSQYIKNNTNNDTIDINKGNSIPDKIKLLKEEHSQLVSDLQDLKNEYDFIKPWGNFDPQEIKKIEEKGYFVKFFIIDSESYKEEWGDLYNLFLINTVIKNKYFMSITKDPNLEKKIGFHAFVFPNYNLTELSDKINFVNKQIIENEKNIKDLSQYIPSIDAAIDDIKSHLRYIQVLESADNIVDDKVMMFEGWVIEKNIEKVSNYLDSKNIFYEIEDPKNGDDIPIQLVNNSFSRLFEPISKIYVLPKYNELDLTPFLAPFFALFFAFILGDAGYGLIIFTVCTLVKILKKDKLSEDVKNFLSLYQLMAVFAFFFGFFITGTVMGFEIFDLKIPFIHKLGAFKLDNNGLFNLSIIIGAIHVLFGMFIKIFNKIKMFGFMHGISQMGWFVLLSSIAFSIAFPHILPLLGEAHKIIIYVCIIPILFFNSPGKNPIVNILSGLRISYDTATALLSDILSYIRLFALCLSGGILSNVFNSLAVGFAPDNIFGKCIVFTIIFLFGHCLTMFLGILGGLVHPMRLTFVEFFKNASFSGGGAKYEPYDITYKLNN